MRLFSRKTDGMTEMPKMRVRRRDVRVWYAGLAVFLMVFSFVFLRGVSRRDSAEVGAASLAGFDPGYIMSDWQMGNYTSMTEAEIQKFLDSKVNCNKDKAYYDYLVATYPGFAWHFDGNHIVCLNEERFGDGEVIGQGDTAARIIWQAAQDYKINPQVLIVLLQKEQSLITDSYPNTRQYRGATGYGCPDTAPCSAEYYGFKNQVRKAAALFRTVLDGGWTNYPLGNNYVQYNPNAACGGTVVNIRSLATSALYRYTPYQPNAAALAAGYGTGDSCGAYGNRNFYLYFEDWFGGIKDDMVQYVPLETPRYFEVIKTDYRINPRTMQEVDSIEKGRILKFTTKVVFGDGTQCLRTEYGSNNNEDICVMQLNLKEIEFEFQTMNGVKEKVIVAGARKIQMRTGEVYEQFNNTMIREMMVKTNFNGETYYITQYDYEHSGSEYGFTEKEVMDVPKFETLSTVKYMTLKHDSNRINPITGEFYSNMTVNTVYKIMSEAEVDGVKYYRTEHNTTNNIMAAMKADDLVEVNFVSLNGSRYMRLKNTAKRINPVTGEVIDNLEKGREISFATKILINGQWYYRTEHNTENNLCFVVLEKDLEEVN